MTSVSDLYRRRSLAATAAPGTFSRARLNGVGTGFRATSAHALDGSPAFEGHRDVLPAGLRGGIIVLATEVNAANQGPELRSHLWAWCMTTDRTIRIRLATNRRLSHFLDGLGVQGVSVGHYFRGYFRSDSGRVFSAQSLAVEVFFADSTTLEQLATDLAVEFRQETVLVKDHNTGEVYFTERGLPTRLRSTIPPS